MSIYAALVAHLSAVSALTALIGARLYPDEIPQGDTLPAVFYMTVSDIKDHVYGAVQAVESPSIQFTVYADTKAEAEAVAEVIKTALTDFSGSMSGVIVQYIDLINELPSMYKSQDGTTKYYTHDLEFEVIFNKE